MPSSYAIDFIRLFFPEALLLPSTLLGFTISCLTFGLIIISFAGLLFLIIEVCDQCEITLKFQLLNLSFHCERSRVKNTLNHFQWDFSKTCLLKEKEEEEKKNETIKEETTKKVDEESEYVRKKNYQKLVDELVNNARDRNENVTLQIQAVQKNIQNLDLVCLMLLCIIIVMACASDRKYIEAMILGFWCTVLNIIYISMTRMTSFHLVFVHLSFTQTIKTTFGISTGKGFIFEITPFKEEKEQEVVLSKENECIHTENEDMKGDMKKEEDNDEESINKEWENLSIDVKKRMMSIRKDYAKSL